MSKLKAQGNASGTGVFTLETPATNTDRTITLPDSTGTLLNNGDAISLADSVKATFGNSDDLQIYHDGTHSRIYDQGTGNLIMQGSSAIVFNASATEHARFTDGGACQLGYGGSTKLATTSTGVNVTGTSMATVLQVADGTDNYLKLGLNGRNTHFTGQSACYMWAGQGSTGDYLAGTLNFQSRSSIDRDINFITGSTPAKRLTIAGNGNVGIGTTSPAYKLSVANNVYVGAQGGSDITLIGGGSGVGSYVDVRYADGVTNTKLAGNGNNYFCVNHGNVGVGTSAPAYKIDTYKSAGDVTRIRTGSTTNINVGMIVFRDGDNNACGQITSNPSTNTTSYNTSSDYRLKENIVPMSASIDRLKELKPYRFNFIKNKDVTVDGFLAHEAQAVVPESVVGDKDAMKTEEYEVTPAVEATYDEEGNELTPAVEAVMGTREVEDYQGIDQSKLVPLLTSALQEAVAKIEALEQRVTTLEGGTV